MNVSEGMDGTAPLVPFPAARRFGAFVARVNRFAAIIDLDGTEVLVHLPNTGRMTELLVPGQPVMLLERSALARKTPYDMVLVEYEGRWVSVDARQPSTILYLTLLAGALPAWAGCVRVRREARYGDSRLDLELWRPVSGAAPTEPAGAVPSALPRQDGDAVQRCLIETKSVNLVVDGRALFPDAPTLRGTRHLQELTRAVAEGIDAAVVFVIQRPDASAFSPFETADPAFARALREAASAGVRVHAYRCTVAPEGIALGLPVPVDLG